MSEGSLDALTGNIEERELTQEMRSSYLDYAMSVIVGRALPGRPGRLQAGPPPGPLRDARPGAAAEPAVPQERLHRRRGDGQVPPARRLGDLRHARPDGAGVLAALPARRRPGQLRVDRRRPRGRDAVHGGPPRPPGDRDAARHRRRHRRLRAQLRRVAVRAAGAAGALPEPARQRLLRDRGRDGDQHPAAQPERVHRRRQGVHAEPRDRPRRPDGAHQGPRLPRRRDDEHGGDPRRLRLRPRLGQGPRPGPRRAAQGRPRVDHRLRAPVPGEEGRRRRPDHEDRRPRPREEDHRDLRPARRVRPVGHAAGDRAQARRRPARGGPQPALQAHLDAEHVRGQHGGAGRRRPEDALAQGADRGLRRPPARGRHPPHAVRAAPRRGTRPHPRGAADRARQPRRGDRADPRLGRHRRRPRRPDREVRALRDPGAGDPRHAPRASDRARVRQGPRRARRARSRRSPSCARSSATRRGSTRSSSPSSTRSTSATATSAAPSSPTSRAT